MRVLALLAFVAVASAYYPTAGSPAYLNDNNVLQYALTLENLEAAFYTQALNTFSAAQFADAGIPANTSYPFLGIIRDHEVFHAQFLSQALRNRGAVPVTPCNYSFSFPDIPTFLAVAAILEDTGVKAYDGAIGSLSQTDLIATAASVATVEGRHAAYIKTLLSQVPFPNVTDVALRADQVFAAAGAFFNGSCISLNNVTSVALLNASSFVNPSALNQTVYNQTAAKLNDDAVLNYALFLENLEANFYAHVLNNISAVNFLVAGIPTSAQNLILLISQHEQTHAALLRTLLTSRGATPVAECSTYAFNYPNSATAVGTFLQDAIALENYGVGAYLGGALGLTDYGLISLAASITTVEARHAAFLTTLWGLTNATVLASGLPAIPFPNATDPIISQSDILGVASLFTPGCPLPALFVNADTFRPNSTVATSASTSSSSSSSTSAVVPTASVTSGSNSATNTATNSATASNSQSSRTVTATATATNTASASVTTPSTRTSGTVTQPNSSASSLMLSVALVASVVALAF